jgi:hypothetical protein
MPLDTSIPLQARFSPINYEIPQPINTLMSAMKIKQLGQENQLNALKTQEYERARDEEAGLRNYLSGGREMPAPDLSSPETRTNLLRFGKTGATYAKALTEQETAALTQKKTQFEVQKARKDFVAQAQRDTSQNPSDANITAYKEDLMANPLFTEAEKAQMAAGADRILAMPVGQRTAFMASQGATASELKPTLTTQNLGKTTQQLSTPAFGGPATVVPGSVQNVAMTLAQEREAKDSAIRIKQEGQRLGLEGRRVAVLEQDAKQKQDPVFQQTMAAAKETGAAIAKGTVAAQQALPGVITNAMIAVNAVDDMIGRQAVKDASGKVIQAATKPHPGFNDAVGATWKPGFRFIPGTNASDFQSYQDQIEGAAFLSAFEALKGGGAISEKEGAKATAAKLRMKLAQSEVEYVKAAREFQDVVRTGVDNARKKFGAGGAPPAAGGADIDALLDKYK